jgi:hypothetical protein
LFARHTLSKETSKRWGQKKGNSTTIPEKEATIRSAPKNPVTEAKKQSSTEILPPQVKVASVSQTHSEKFAVCPLCSGQIPVGSKEDANAVISTHMDAGCCNKTPANRGKVPAKCSNSNDSAKSNSTPSSSSSDTSVLSPFSWNFPSKSAKMK